MLWRFRREIILLVCLFFSVAILKATHVWKAAGVQSVRQIRENIPIVRSEMALENDRLRKLLALKERREPFSRVVAAEVVSLQPSVFPGEVVVGKGRKDGIEANMTILSTDGYLLGRIVELKEDCSRGVTIFHTKSKVSVLIQGTRDLGVLEGGAFPLLTLKYLKKESAVSVGDTVITSGFSDFYPKGVPVGTVRTVEKVPREFFLKVQVAPYAGSGNFEEVALGK